MVFRLPYNAVPSDSDIPMNPLSDEFHELMLQQTSYSALVAWLQQRQGFSYTEACQQMNQMLQQYRHHHAAP